jgi:beta-lactamase regulating signal transducer with metallopeptidase domain
VTPALLVEATVDRLAGASIAIALMAAVAWLVCRVRPSLAPATRTAIWWLVAAAALLRLAPVPALTIEVPAAWNVGAVLPSRPAMALAPIGTLLETQPAMVPPAVTRPALETPFVPITAAEPGGFATREPWAAAVASTDWRGPLVSMWAVIALALLIHLVVATRRMRTLVAAAEPAPAELDAEAAQLAASLGLRRTPRIRVSDAVDTPQVLGVMRPTVLLPAETLDTLTPRERTMTLCHELVHVRRRDLTFAWAPAVMERLLFFHPAARLAAREYDVAREAACDAEVLQHLGEAPRDYGRLLLRIGVTRRPAALAVAQSSPSTRLLRRRLAMLNDHAAPARATRGLWLAGACVAVLAMPLSLVARQDDIPPPPAPPTPPTAAAPVGPPAPPSAPAPFAAPAPPAIPSRASLAAVPRPPAPPAASVRRGRLAAPPGPRTRRQLHPGGEGVARAVRNQDGSRPVRLPQRLNILI